MSDNKIDVAALEQGHTQQALSSPQPGPSFAPITHTHEVDPVAAEKEWNKTRHQNSVFPWTSAGLKEYLMMEVDPSQSSGPLSAFCFMTGFMYVEVSSVLSFFRCAYWIDYTVTRSRSRPSLSGVVSKLEIPCRYVTSTL